MRFVLGFSALIVPTTLIGGTLPVMIKYFAQGLHRIGNVTAKLYSVNTFGAVIGTVLAGFFLIAWFGVNGTVYFAAFLNSAIGSAALYIWHKEKATLQSEKKRFPGARQRRRKLSRRRVTRECGWSSGAFSCRDLPPSPLRSYGRVP